MKKNIFYRLLLYAFLVALVILPNDRVFANFKFEQEDTNNLYSHCSSDNKCLPVCVYGNDEAFIGYYYDDQDSSSKSSWEVGFLRDLSDYSSSQGAHYFSGNRLFYWKDKYLLTTNIYSGSLEEDWSGTEMYNDLLNNFKCPTYLYIDESNLAPNNELCFSNSLDKCPAISDAGFDITKTVKFESYLHITYNLSDQLNRVNNQVYELRHFNDNNNIHPTEKTKFIYTLDGSIDYDTSITPDENVKKSCNHFKEKIGNDKGKSYTDELMNSQYVSSYFTDLNKSYEESVSRQSRYVKNPEIFNYDTQKILLVYENT